MKWYNILWKVLAVLAAVAVAIYVGITYGDKIVAWVKKVLKLDCKEEVCCCEGECAEGCCEGECAEGCCEEAAEEGAVEAEETDFEG